MSPSRITQNSATPSTHTNPEIRSGSGLASPSGKTRQAQVGKGQAPKAKMAVLEFTGKLLSNIKELFSRTLSWITERPQAIDRIYPKAQDAEGQRNIKQDTLFKFAEEIGQRSSSRQGEAAYLLRYLKKMQKENPEAFKDFIHAAEPIKQSYQNAMEAQYEFCKRCYFAGQHTRANTLAKDFQQSKTVFLGLELLLQQASQLVELSSAESLRPLKRSSQLETTGPLQNFFRDHPQCRIKGFHTGKSFSLENLKHNWSQLGPRTARLSKDNFIDTLQNLGRISEKKPVMRGMVRSLISLDQESTLSLAKHLDQQHQYLEQKIDTYKARLSSQEPNDLDTKSTRQYIETLENEKAGVEYVQNMMDIAMASQIKNGKQSTSKEWYRLELRGMNEQSLEQILSTRQDGSPNPHYQENEAYVGYLKERLQQLQPQEQPRRSMGENLIPPTPHNRSYSTPPRHSPMQREDPDAASRQQSERATPRGSHSTFRNSNIPHVEDESLHELFFEDLEAMERDMLELSQQNRDTSGLQDTERGQTPFQGAAALRAREEQKDHESPISLEALSRSSATSLDELLHEEYENDLDHSQLGLEDASSFLNSFFNNAEDEEIEKLGENLGMRELTHKEIEEAATQRLFSNAQADALSLVEDITDSIHQQFNRLPEEATLEDYSEALTHAQEDLSQNRLFQEDDAIEAGLALDALYSQRPQGLNFIESMEELENNIRTQANESDGDSSSLQQIKSNVQALETLAQSIHETLAPIAPPIPDEPPPNIRPSLNNEPPPLPSTPPPGFSLAEPTQAHIPPPPPLPHIATSVRNPEPPKTPINREHLPSNELGDTLRAGLSNIQRAMYEEEEDEDNDVALSHSSNERSRSARESQELARGPLIASAKASSSQVTHQEPNPDRNGRTALMEAIKKGMTLNKVPSSEEIRKIPDRQDDIFSQLQTNIEARMPVHEEEEDNDEEWA